MENKIIVANLKMYMDKEETLSYIKDLSMLKQRKQILICPSALYLPYFIEAGYTSVIQNISTENKGAYTGEISGRQAASLGVKACLIGHSEYRERFHEENAEIEEKIKEALQNHLQVILCVGETLEEKETLKAESVLVHQLAVLEKVAPSFDGQIWLAYEPVWAVGTGWVPTNHLLRERILFIRNQMKNRNGRCDIPVLYGGSITKENIEALCQMKEVNGFLIGKASTDIKELSKIIEVAVTM